MRIAAVAVITAAALGFQGTALAGADNLPTIYVNYTMNCTFGMSDAMGKALTSIPPGAYQILVTSPVPFAAVDLAGINDMTACKGSAAFQLTGPGVSLTTTMDDGDSDSAFIYATFLPSSTYTAVDTTQPAVARYTFTTTASGTAAAPVTTPAVTTPAKSQGSTTTPAPVSPAVSPAKGTLTATVTPAGAVKLSWSGKAVTVLHAGRYTFVVTDRSPHDGFLLERGSQKSRWLTGKAFVGRHTETLMLTKGEWAFYSSGPGAKTYFTVLG